MSVRLGEKKALFKLKRGETMSGNRTLLLVLVLAASILSVQCENKNKKEVQEMIRVESGSFLIGDTWGDGEDDVITP
ncbi:MAG: hypothetical protein XE05_1736 [Thermotogales bacterium 46_20]|nr:MAG: hypothetical protein XE05_1736 [Thermotogales bacterium 46_20]